MAMSSSQLAFRADVPVFQDGLHRPHLQQMSEVRKGNYPHLRVPSLNLAANDPHTPLRF